MVFGGQAPRINLLFSSGAALFRGCSYLRQSPTEHTIALPTASTCRTLPTGDAYSRAPNIPCLEDPSGAHTRCLGLNIAQTPHTQPVFMTTLG